MAAVDVKSQSGNTVGSVDLVEDIFGLEPNVPVMHQVVTAQLAARRAGSQSTKTRAEVKGGGAKPWRQKGTGRARAHLQRTPKKMTRLALRSALADRAADGKVVVLDDWGLESPSTRRAAQALDSLGVTGR